MDNNIPITDWIISIASIISTLSVGIVAVQLLLQKRQLKSDHERSRRENAVKIIQRWNESLDFKNSLARKFAENLNETTLKSIFREEEFFLEKNDNNILVLEALFDDFKIEEGSNIRVEANDNNNALVVDKKNFCNYKIKIPQKYSSQIRWYLIKYLNKLEGIVSAWVYNVADRELIEQELKYLFSTSNGALKKFREIVGETSFPCIELFEFQMKDLAKSPLKKKMKL